MTVIESCRGCGSGDLEDVLSLGTLPLANALLPEADLGNPEPRFPLTLAFCRECSLAQIRETVAPEILFRRYLYFSSFSDTMLAHAREEARFLTERTGLGPESLVVEIASNDGYLLRNFVERGIPVLGIEPAENVAAEAVRKGVPTRAEFFDAALARRLAAEGRRADVVIANNVLAHVADLHGVARGIAVVLKEGGVAAVEFPYVADMLEALEFDTIYHEHLCYFSLHAVSGIFARHGLVVEDVERHAIHGGSLRVILRHPGPARPTPAVRDLLDREVLDGLITVAPYRRFASRVGELRVSLLAELRSRKERGETLAAYGASAKGSTLMNAFGIGPDLLEFVADRSTVKQGLFTPGNHLPIVGPEALLTRRPDAVLLLTWNFRDEIVRQQSAYLDRGGVFLVPVPEVQALTKEALA